MTLPLFDQKLTSLIMPNSECIALILYILISFHTPITSDYIVCCYLCFIWKKKMKSIAYTCPAGKTVSRSRCCTERFPFVVAVFSFSNDLLVNVGFKLSTLKNIKRAHLNSLSHFVLKINNYYSFKKELNSVSTQVLHFRAYTVLTP